MLLCVEETFVGAKPFPFQHTHDKSNKKPALILARQWKLGQGEANQIFAV